jgi:hypothetical protein
MAAAGRGSQRPAVSATRSPRIPHRRLPAAERGVVRQVEQRHLLADRAPEPQGGPVKLFDPRMRAKRAGERSGEQCESEQRAPRNRERRQQCERRMARGDHARDERPEQRRGAPSRLDVRLERGEPLGADARHVREVVDRAKAAVLAPVGHDLLRGRRPDAVQGLQLLERRAPEADRRRRRPRAAGSAEGAATAVRDGTTICWPSASRAARLTASRFARRRAPPARRTASSTRAPRAASTRPDGRTAPATCTTERRPPDENATCAGRWQRHGGGRRRRGPQVAHPQQPDDDRQRDVGHQLRARDLGHAPTLGANVSRKTRAW